MRLVPSETIRKSLALLASPLIWAAHLTVVYAVVSVEITLLGTAGLASDVLIGIATLAALGAILWIGRSLARNTWPKWPEPQQDLVDLWRKAGVGLAVLSFLGVLWQGVPPLLVPGDPDSHSGNSTLGVDQRPMRP